MYLRIINRRKSGIKLKKLLIYYYYFQPETLQSYLRLDINFVGVPTKGILPFISAPWRNAAAALRWKGADLAVL